MEQCEVCKHTVPLNSIDNGVCTRCRDLVGYPEWGEDDPPSGVDALAQCGATLAISGDCLECERTDPHAEVGHRNGEVTWDGWHESARIAPTHNAPTPESAS